MKIAFFGTSDRALPILENINANFELALCVTKADSLVGRKHEVRETGVKVWAKEQNIPCFEIRDIKSDKEAIIKQLSDYNIELGIVADFSYILNELIINTPIHKMINIHFSLLPKYRGASPVQFAIINNDRVTGITYYLMTKGLDNGPVLYKFEYPLKGDETSGDLYRTLFKLAGGNLPDVITNYSTGNLKAIEQNESEATYTYSKSHPKNTFIYKEDAKIDWTEPLELIERRIRAYNPWPIAWTTLKDLGDSPLNLNFKPGKNTDTKVKLFEAKRDIEKLLIKTIQVEGGKILEWDAFKNGYLI